MINFLRDLIQAYIDTYLVVAYALNTLMER